MENLIKDINQYNWTEWILDDIHIDFENIIINLSFYSSHSAVLHLKNYIGFSYYGHWDESVIKKSWWIKAD